MAGLLDEREFQSRHDYAAQGPRGAPPLATAAIGARIARPGRRRWFPLASSSARCCGSAYLATGDGARAPWTIVPVYDTETWRW